MFVMKDFFFFCDERRGQFYYLEKKRRRELYALGREKELMKKRGMNVKRGKRG